MLARSVIANMDPHVADTRNQPESVVAGHLRRLLLWIWMLLFFSGLIPQYLHVSGGIPGIREVSLGLFCIIAFWMVMVCRVRGIEYSALVVWAFAYFSVTVIWCFAAPSVGHEQVAGVLAAGLFGASVVISLVVFGYEQSIVDISRAAVVIAVISVVLNVFELTRPFAFSNAAGRSAGLYVNPTIAGEALVLLMILSSRAIRPRWQLLFQAFIGIGVLATFSRSAYIGWFIVLILLQWRAARKRLGEVTLSWAILAGFAVFVFLAAWQMRIGAQFWGPIVNRISSTDSLVNRLKFAESGSTLQDERVGLATAAFRQLGSHLILGGGTGTEAIVVGGATQLGPHNMFLMMGLQAGIVGVVLLLWFLMVVRNTICSETRDLSVPLFVYLLLLVPFTHNMFQQAHFAIAVAAVWTLASQKCNKDRLYVLGRGRWR